MSVKTIARAALRARGSLTVGTTWINRRTGQTAKLIAISDVFVSMSDDLIVELDRFYRDYQLSPYYRAIADVLRDLYKLADTLDRDDVQTSAAACNVRAIADRFIDAISGGASVPQS